MKVWFIYMHKVFSKRYVLTNYGIPGRKAIRHSIDLVLCSDSGTGPVFCIGSGFPDQPEAGKGDQPVNEQEGVARVEIQAVV